MHIASAIALAALATLTLALPADITTPNTTDLAVPATADGVSALLPETPAHAAQEAHPHTLQARANGKDVGFTRVHYCQHASGGGGCANQDFKSWICYNFAPSWNDRISSIYLMNNNQCWLYTDGNCRGRNIAIRAPGEGNLKTRAMNDQASSIQCTGWQIPPKQ